MFIRGNTYKAWVSKALEEKCFTREVENGCHIEVRARERDDAGRRQKLSATPDLSGTVLPYVLFRTQR